MNPASGDTGSDQPSGGLSLRPPEDHTKLSYRLIRGFHTLWSGLVCPLALVHFHNTEGPGSGPGFLAMLWGATAVIFAEQYFYPERLAGALWTTGTITANLVLSFLVTGPQGILTGFYLTFLSGLVFVALAAAALFFTPLWQAIGFSNPLIARINGIRGLLNFYFIWALLCVPVLLGPVLFIKPLLGLTGLGWPFYLLAGLMLLQGARMIGQVVRAMRGTDGPAKALSKRLYDGGWGTASAVVWIIQFGFCLPLIFR
jgi:hypothetical protein